MAANDAYTTDEDTPRTVAAPGVLGNDSDVDGVSLTAVLVTGPAHGTLTLNADGSFTYTPAANYNGPDSFTYQASDGLAQSTVATVSVTINPVNDAPVAVNDTYTTTQDTPLTVPAPGVLGNDTDVDGGTLTAALVTGPANGTLTLNADGSFTYTPAAGFSGTDSFTYQASDGTAASAPATVSLTIEAATTTEASVLGTDGTDVVIVTLDANVVTVTLNGVTKTFTGLTHLDISGLGGDDVIIVQEVPLAGAALLQGPSLEIVVDGGAGLDALIAAAVTRTGVTLLGGAGDDLLQGGAGADRLEGGDGNDVLLGEAGNDALFGDAGKDLLLGGRGLDVLTGGRGFDLVIGGPDDDILPAAHELWIEWRRLSS